MSGSALHRRVPSLVALIAITAAMPVTSGAAATKLNQPIVGIVPR
jgi:hypothetical protein